MGYLATQLTPGRQGIFRIRSPHEPLYLSAGHGGSRYAHFPEKAKVTGLSRQTLEHDRFSNNSRILPHLTSYGGRCRHIAECPYGLSSAEGPYTDGTGTPFSRK
jgi:hypothetical protein